MSRQDPAADGALHHARKDLAAASHLRRVWTELAAASRRDVTAVSGCAEARRAAPRNAGTHSTGMDRLRHNGA